jgi:hypothetical protein
MTERKLIAKAKIAWKISNAPGREYFGPPSPSIRKDLLHTQITFNTHDYHKEDRHSNKIEEDISY